MGYGYDDSLDGMSDSRMPSTAPAPPCLFEPPLVADTAHLRKHGYIFKVSHLHLCFKKFKYILRFSDVL